MTPWARVKRWTACTASSCHCAACIWLVKEPAQERWKSYAACLPQGAFWGADLVGEGGLLERLYAGLALPRRVWLGLKRLPEVAGIADSQRRHYMALVANHLKARPGSVVCLQGCPHAWRDA